MIVEKNKVVSLIYELRAGSNTEEVVEKLNESNPLTFLFGSGSLLPKFESNIDGLKVGDGFDFRLASTDAYGDIINDAIVEVPKNVFLVDGELDNDLLTVGNSIPMMDSQGNRLSGVVLNVADDSVKMDFNHPLAGEDLIFKGKVVDIREATEEEVTHGHLHGNSSCGGECGGGCGGHDEEGEGNCGSGCCGSCQ